MQTRTGSCDPTASYAVTVQDGKVSGPGKESGTVSRSGNVRVSLGAAYAIGQLDGGLGSGRLERCVGRRFLQRAMGGFEAVAAS